MDGAYEVGERVELIHPARFLFNAGSTPKAWNKKMLNDEHFKVLMYEADSGKIFPNTDIKGGIAVTCRDRGQNFGKIENFIVFDELRSIDAKVAAEMEDSLAKIVYPSESYRFTEQMHKENPDAEKLLSKGHKYDFKTSVLDKLGDKIFFDEAPEDGEEYVGIIGLINAKRVTRYIRRKYIKEPDNFIGYKILVPAANGSGALGEVLSTPLIGHTQTFISVGNFETETEAEACFKYIKSKFARVLLGILKITQHNLPDKWRCFR